MGRFSDGHELINWSGPTAGIPVNGFTTVNAVSDHPGNGLFITEPNAPYDWRTPQNDNLWQGESGINNPCPQGYRIPSNSETIALFMAEGITNYTTAAGSSLAFSASGSRDGSSNTAPLDNVGLIGSYWHSTVSGVFTFSNVFAVNLSNLNNVNRRIRAYNVRCIKD